VSTAGSGSGLEVDSIPLTVAPLAVVFFDKREYAGQIL
jgi:hypothetical protein